MCLIGRFSEVIELNVGCYALKAKLSSENKQYIVDSRKLLEF